jgi:hypothetical protein
LGSVEVAALESIEGVIPCFVERRLRDRHVPGVGPRFVPSESFGDVRWRGSRGLVDLAAELLVVRDRPLRGQTEHHFLGLLGQLPRNEILKPSRACHAASESIGRAAWICQRFTQNRSGKRAKSETKVVMSRRTFCDTERT